jgi:hypothetical protein
MSGISGDEPWQFWIGSAMARLMTNGWTGYVHFMWDTSFDCGMFGKAWLGCIWVVIGCEVVWPNLGVSIGTGQAFHLMCIG